MKFLVLLIVVGGALLLNAALYTVSETETVVITNFGDPVGEPIREAGLHFKTPFVNEVHRFDERILEWDGDANLVPTAEKTFIFVDTTARWRIADPLKFLKTLRDEDAARSRLDDILDNATRTWISSHSLIEAVRSTNRTFASELTDDASLGDTQQVATKIVVGREKIVEGILQQARPSVRELGIELVDFRFRRIEYEESTRQKVYGRMTSERQRVAEKYLSEGRGRQAEIEGQKEKELRRIASEAERKAETLRGEADAEASRIYAEAYSKDPEFYAFFQSLETWKRALGASDTTLVLSTSSELLQHLRKAEN
ncbi:MAG: protease modulator HflC [Planctomycetes bacterium]|nr:protease modulator HflC [Planctomycetota bacterium]MCC7171504.1 protease modulator HflC [Planctomycetota bacterium]